MGTQKQADTLIKLTIKAGRLKNAAHEAELRAAILAASQDEVQGLFDTLNELLGFNKKISPATPKQILLLASLEREIYGTALDFRTRGRLTYDEADASIKLYRTELAERKALKSVETKSSLQSLI